MVDNGTAWKQDGTDEQGRLCIFDGLSSTSEHLLVITIPHQPGTNPLGDFGLDYILYRPFADSIFRDTTRAILWNDEAIKYDKNWNALPASSTDGFNLAQVHGASLNMSFTGTVIDAFGSTKHTETIVGSSLSMNANVINISKFYKLLFGTF